MSKREKFKTADAFNLAQSKIEAQARIIHDGFVKTDDTKAFIEYIVGRCSEGYRERYLIALGYNLHKSITRLREMGLAS